MTYDVRGKEVKNNTLLNLTFNTMAGTFETGEDIPLFTQEQRDQLTFNKHKWLGGEMVVSYGGSIIFITTNGLKANHDTAMNIKDAIITGYHQMPELLEY